MKLLDEFFSDDDFKKADDGVSKPLKHKKKSILENKPERPETLSVEEGALVFQVQSTLCSISDSEPFSRLCCAEAFIYVGCVFIYFIYSKIKKYVYEK